MEKVKIITAEEAANLLQDGDTLTTSGFVSSCIPEALNKAVEKRFLNTGHPKNLTYIYASSQGNKKGCGGEHYAHKGLLKRFVAAHWATVPSLGEMALRNEFEAYNLPQGALCHLFRDIAGKKPGTITQVGLGTFVDPRNGGGKLNEVTTEDMVELMRVRGREYLFYPSFPIQVAFLRGTYADETGNVSLEKEVATLEATSVAQAVKNSGGIVVVQVEAIVAAGTLDPRMIKIPRIYVDCVVVAAADDHEQCLGCSYDPSICGERRVLANIAASDSFPMSAKKIIGRRGMLELKPGDVVNLGVGAPEYVAAAAAEEGIGDRMTLTVESGLIGGIPQGGPRFGSSQNAEAVLDQGYQFDFYDGGGLDSAFLGLAECDEMGNINVSRFGPKIAGCGGFIDISQNTGRVCFCGTFTAGGLKVRIADGKVYIDQEGKQKKFLKKVEEVTFSGDMAIKNGQHVQYITERCVLELREDGLHLIEIAPGIDLETQILQQMEFSPILDKINGEIPLMDSRIFDEGIMGMA